MTVHNQIQLFETKKIRTIWDDDAEKWYFSVVDVVSALTDSVNPTDYIKKMRRRDPILAQGWGQIVTPPLRLIRQAVNKKLIAPIWRVYFA